ncbi:Cullin-associated NEDD8-dissociated protein 1 [Nymphon striatum]|nr:Cullin-associated NEDD8-dissociated protein 1 [Nymphon striatum]
MTSSDKDFRFMATNDLMTDLQKDSIKLDDDSERKVVKMLLKLLEDKNGEVQNLAVKCLGPLVNKVKEYQVETIVDTLCNNMLSEKEQLRDICSIGLKTVICELPPLSTGLAASICKRITGRLSSAIAKQEDVSVQLEALDILGDLLSRFGGLLVGFHPAIQEALLPQLVQSKTCSSKTFYSCYSRHAGHRFGEHLERVMPLIVEYCKLEDDELREYCIQAFESFIRRCPKEISNHVNMITTICLKYLCYDPNYNYDDDDSDDENSMDFEGEDDEGQSDDEYSDDDDMSWKVRRASAKSLEAIIATRHEMLSEFYRIISPALIARFKEREENVKADIFHAYMALLKQTRPTASSLAMDADAMEQEEGPILMLQNQVPFIVKALHKHMKEKSVKTRQGCFAMLTELVSVLSGALTDHIPLLIPGIQYSLCDKGSSSNMKIDTLAFLHCLLTQHAPEVFHPYISTLVPTIIFAVQDSFYKITSEALLVLQQVVKVIRPLNTTVSSNFDFTSYYLDLYNCTLVRLRAADIDQEVKERAISCMGQIICNMGDHLTNELKVCLPIFLDRLKNEITRLTTVKALTKIAGSPLSIDVSPILKDSMPILASFLRKNQRSLKLSTLTLLDVLVKNYDHAITVEMLQGVMVELSSLIHESDLHISQLTFVLLTSLTKTHPYSLLQIEQSILPAILKIIQSPLLQGAALNSLLEFFKALVLLRFPELDYRSLLVKLTTVIYGSSTVKSNEQANLPRHSPFNQLPSTSTSTIHKQAYHSTAKCVAAITVACPKEAEIVVNSFLENCQNVETDDCIKLFSLLAVGEIGKHMNLSDHPKLKDILLDSFGSQSEEIKSAASFALGNVTVGNLSVYLPFILNQIENEPRRQYLLLNSLKEVINSLSTTPEAIQSLQPFVSSIWSMLFSHCECNEEGTRNLVAECLGRLTLIDPPTLLPHLQSYLSSTSALARSTVVTAVKFTISEQPQKIDGLLRASIGNFLQLLDDEDLDVRRVALVTFNSAAHNKPSLIKDLLDSTLPQLYNETKVRKHLIREVEMGPFKHTVDDGLDLRKAAFECMYTLLDSCLERIDIFEFLNHVENGLKDHYDIKMLTYLMLVRLAHLCPSAVLQRLERLIEPLRITCTAKVKANAVKQEFEKHDELKRSALRALASLLQIPESDKNPMMCDFLTHIRSSSELNQIFEGIQKDVLNNPSEWTMEVC